MWVGCNGISVAGFQNGAFDYDKRKSGNAFQTFIGGGNQCVDASFFKVDWNRAKTAHRIHDVGSPSCFDNGSDFLDRIQDAGSGFAMHHCDCGDPRISFQSLANIFRTG